MTETRSIESILIGDRVRKEMGDIKGLAGSLQREGMLHPVVILSDGTLVCGHRRIAAAAMLGWEDVPVTVVDVSDLLTAERDENEARKNFTPTEAVALGRMIEARERPRVDAEKRERLRLTSSYVQAARRGEPVGEKPPARPKQDVREIASKSVGMGAQQYGQAKAVVLAAEADPETYGDLPGKMDETRNIKRTHDELIRRKNGTESRSAVHYKAQYPKPNREMERGLITLEGLVSGFGLIALDQLDGTKTEEWCARLKAAASFLNSLSRKVGRKNVQAEG
jgi:hypothetical protein